MERITTGTLAVALAFALTLNADAHDFNFREHGLHSFHVDAARARAKSQTIPATVGTNQFEITSRVTVEVDNETKLNTVLRGSQLHLARKVTEHVFILQAPDALTAAQEAHRLSVLAGVKQSIPVMRRPIALHGPYAAQPSDYFFGIHGAFGEGFHWYLENRNADGSRAGYDLNVLGAWPYTLGDGVTIAIADTGIELNHPELASRTAGAPHFNFADGTTNAGPSSATANGAHATQVAGLAAADVNNKRMVGVAPHAQLASWVIFGSNSFANDEQLMDMYQFQSNNVAVQNHSWGHTGLTQMMPGALEQIGISNAITFGRGGLGAVMVRSAGNDRGQGANADDDGSPSDPRVIAVAASRIDGRVASYSEPGACVLVAAPSGEINQNGLFTTDLTGTRGVNQVNFFPPFDDLNNYVYYSLGFVGTSASAPLISGIAALMLSANPNLAYRDVQQILLLSARHIDLADPDIVTNGAGFLISHNQGFGVPDAAVAVNLARHWANRPPMTNTTVTVATTTPIPDDGLRVLTTGGSLAPIHTLPGTGLHADNPTAQLPLVYVGLATNPIAINLTNKGALIERGTNNFDQKIDFAAQAGAAFVIIRNFATNSDPNSAPGGDQLIPMTADFATIPAVFIGYNDGVALENLVTTNPAATAQIFLNSTAISFPVTNSLLCEHVGLRVTTDHPLRGDLRITLVSPSGTRSVLQRFNGDVSAGPVDWTYWSTHNFFESSIGNWTAYFSDEYEGSTGSVQSVSLTVQGVPILDTDHDGLDDNWENAHFGSLAYGPKDDPDHDGYNNMREYLMATDPMQPAPIVVDFSRWNSALARVSWTSTAGTNYNVLAGSAINTLGPVANLTGAFPETEWFVPYTNAMRFFEVQRP